MLIINGEDDPAFTIRPRIDALGGDPKRIRYMASYSPLDDEGLEELHAEIKAHKPDLIIIDPVFSYVPATANLFQANQIRAFLTQLSELARAANAALVVLRHLRKAGGDKQLYAGAGSIDVIAVARSAIRIFQHPDDEDLKVFSHLKHNLSEEGKSWQYRIAVEDGGKMPRVIWEGPCDLRAADASEDSKPKAVLDRAKFFLNELLVVGAQPVVDTENKLKAAASAKERSTEHVRNFALLPRSAGKSGSLACRPTSTLQHSKDAKCAIIAMS